MSSKPYNLRCKTKTGTVTVDCLTQESTVEELKAILYSLTGVVPHRLKVLRGYPPSPIDLSNDKKKLNELFCQVREMLIVEELSDNDSRSQSANLNNTLDNKDKQQSTQPSQTPIFGNYSAPNLPPSSHSPSLVANPLSQQQKTPPALTAQTPKASSNALLTNSQDYKPVDCPGLLMRRVVPANNSCLFTSIHFCLSGGKYDESAGSSLRKIIADTVSSDPVTYNDAFLGKPNLDYCKWILNEDHWGGAIEISILSNHYSIEIVAVDTQNIRLNRFGEDKNYKKRILLIYDGIHYDPLMMEPFSADGKSLPVQTIFATSNSGILEMALEVAREAQASRQYTDVQNFSLKCLVCNAGLKGQIGARQHAKETGHINFGEI